MRIPRPWQRNHTNRHNDNRNTEDKDYEAFRQNPNYSNIGEEDDVFGMKSKTNGKQQQQQQQQSRTTMMMTTKTMTMITPQEHFLLSGTQKPSQQKQQQHQHVPPWQSLRLRRLATWRPRQEHQQQEHSTASSFSLSFSPSPNPVVELIRIRQEETWNAFQQEVLNPLFLRDEEESSMRATAEIISSVLKGLFYMGISISVLECAACVMAVSSSPSFSAVSEGEGLRNHHYINCHKNEDEALLGLAQFLVHGVTRVPTPAGISQRLALLHVVCTYREQQQLTKQRKQTQPPRCHDSSPRTMLGSVDDETLDPVLLWNFLLDRDVGDDNAGDKSNKTEDRFPEWQYVLLSSLGEDDSRYVWCWELRALVQWLLANEDHERKKAQATAEQVARKIRMAASTMELTLNEATMMICRGMGHGCEWIKVHCLVQHHQHQHQTQHTTPIAHATPSQETLPSLLPPHDHFDRTFFYHYDDDDYGTEENKEEDFCDQFSDVSLLLSPMSSTFSVVTNMAAAPDYSGAFSACSLSSSWDGSQLSDCVDVHGSSKCRGRRHCSSSSASSSSVGRTRTSKTKQVIVEEAYTSYSRLVRQATERARETTLSFVHQWNEVRGRRVCDAVASTRVWAAASSPHPHARHWVYVDAASHVGLASLAAMDLLAKAMRRNTHAVLDHTATVTTDLIQHRFGSTAAQLFDNLTRTALNVLRMAHSLASLGTTPAVVVKLGAVQHQKATASSSNCSSIGEKGGEEQKQQQLQLGQLQEQE